MFVEEKREGEVRPMTPRLEPWQQSCLEAANYLATYGWQRGNYGAEVYGKPACMIGALRLFEKGTDEGTHPLYRRMLKILGQSPEKWNDNVDQTADDVIFLLEKMALEKPEK